MDQQSMLINMLGKNNSIGSLNNIVDFQKISKAVQNQIQPYNSFLRFTHKIADTFIKPEFPIVSTSLASISSLNFINSNLSSVDILSGSTFLNIQKAVSNINFDKEETEILKEFDEDPELKEAASSLIKEVNEILSRPSNGDEKALSINDLIIEFVSTRLTKFTKQQIAIFVFVITFLLTLTFEKTVDHLLTKGDKEDIINTNDTNTKKIIKNESETKENIIEIKVQLESVEEKVDQIKTPEVDIIIKNTFLYTDMSTQSKKIVKIKAPMEVRIIDFKPEWCYIEILDNSQKRGWIKNLMIERFQ